MPFVAFIEPCFGIGHNLSLICQMTSEDIKHQLIIIITCHHPHRFSELATKSEKWNGNTGWSNVSMVDIYLRKLLSVGVLPWTC